MSLNLKNMSTETRNQNTMNLDIMSPLEVVTVMNQEDAKVPAAITPALPNIAQCVTWAIESIEAGKWIKSWWSFFFDHCSFIADCKNNIECIS